MLVAEILVRPRLDRSQINHGFKKNLQDIKKSIGTTSGYFFIFFLERRCIDHRSFLERRGFCPQHWNIRKCYKCNTRGIPTYWTYCAWFKQIVTFRAKFVFILNYWNKINLLFLVLYGSSSTITETFLVLSNLTFSNNEIVLLSGREISSVFINGKIHLILVITKFQI